MKISVPTGELRCISAPMVCREVRMRLRDCVTPEEQAVVPLSTMVMQMVRGYIPESIKRLGDVCNQFHQTDRSLCAPVFVF